MKTTYMENDVAMSEVIEIEISELRKKLKTVLPKRRYLHCVGTEEKARELANQFGVDSRKAAIAGLLHDCARYMTKEETFFFIEEHQIPVSVGSKDSLSILHAYAGEYLAKKEYGIKDYEILSAIKNHTTGRKGMSDLDKIVYLADKIEERTRDPLYIKDVKETLEQTNDLDEAVLVSYAKTIAEIVKKHGYIHPETINNWNYMVKNMGKVQTLPFEPAAMDGQAQQIS